MYLPLRLRSDSERRADGRQMSERRRQQNRSASGLMSLSLRLPRRSRRKKDEIHANTLKINYWGTQGGSSMLQFETSMEKSAVIKVIGVGRGGCNAVNRMVLPILIDKP